MFGCVWFVDVIVENINWFVDVFYFYCVIVLDIGGWMWDWLNFVCFF